MRHTQRLPILAPRLDAAPGDALRHSLGRPSARHFRGSTRRRQAMGGWAGQPEAGLALVFWGPEMD